MLGEAVEKNNTFFIACIITFSLFTNIFSGDFQFPSKHPPRGMDPAKTPQFICLGFDDNPYTGENGSVYYESGSWETGSSTSGEGQGLKWIRDVLLKDKKNPDNSNCHASFYMICGQAGVYNNSQRGATNITWGREVELIPACYKSLEAAGHEVANHTLDHLEVNVRSTHDSSLNPLCTGMTMAKSYCFVDGVDYYSEVHAEYPDAKGWKDYAGRELTSAAWQEILEDADQHLKSKAQISSLTGFRAPRLEYNSNLFTALSSMNYDYDCSIEEGLQFNEVASNMVWPYTVNNGSPGVWVAEDFDDNAATNPAWPNSRVWPESIWELPTHVIVVPENLRATIASRVGGGFQDQEIIDAFEADGKISGLDFNLYVDWLLTPDEWYTTMVYNLEERLNGNRAPMIYGCHSQYYHGAYDFETLKMDTKFKKVLDYSTFDTRAKKFEDFVDYAISKNCYIVSGKEMVDWMRNPVDLDGTTPTENVGAEKSVTLGDLEYDNQSDTLNSTASSSVSGGVLECTFLVKNPIPDKDMWPSPSITTTMNFPELTHISFDYSTTHPFKFVLQVEDGDETIEYGALISHIDPSASRNSGKIAFRDFELDQWYTGDAQVEPDLSKIVGFAIAPNLPAQSKDENVTIKISNLKINGDFSTDIVLNNINSIQKNISINSIKSDKILFNVGMAGNYNFQIFNLNGRLVQNVKKDFSVGHNIVSLKKHLVPGLYFVKVKDINSSKVSVTKALIKNVM